MAENSCNHCGVCCQKGGPALHLNDLEKVLSGRIPLADLFTIRPGEPVYDNVQGEKACTTADIVKLKGLSENNWQCVYYEETTHRCGIYHQRPVECRRLNCQNTASLSAFYRNNRLDRATILRDVPALQSLITDHDIKCSLAVVKKAAEQIQTTGNISPEHLERLSRAVHYDRHLRLEFAGRQKNGAALTDFLFGLPLSRILERYGLYLHLNEGRQLLKRTG